MEYCDITMDYSLTKSMVAGACVDSVNDADHVRIEKALQWLKWDGVKLWCVLEHQCRCIQPVVEHKKIIG